MTIELAQKLSALQSSRLCIWKQLPSSKVVGWVQKKIQSYLDERMKSTPSESALDEKVQYLQKDENARLKVFGFLREDIFKTEGVYPHRLDGEDLVKAASENWVKRLRSLNRNRKTVAHHFVLSLTPKLNEAMEELGSSSDQLLTEAGRTVMRRYQEKYYPSEKVTFLMGLHHDCKHMHAHILLFPTAESGKRLRISNESKNEGGRRIFDFLKEQAEKEVDRYFEKHILGPLIQTDNSYHDGLCHRVVARSVIAAEKPKDLQAWNRVQTVLFEVGESTPKSFQYFLHSGFESLVRANEAMRKKWSENPGFIEDSQKATVDQGRWCKKKVQQLRDQLNQLRIEENRARSDRIACLRDFGQWKRVKHSCRSNSSGAIGYEHSRWLQDRLMKNDGIAAAMREYLSSAEKNKLLRQSSDRNLRRPKGFSSKNVGYPQRIDSLEKGISEFWGTVGKDDRLTQRFCRQMTAGSPFDDHLIHLLMRKQLEVHQKRCKELQEKRRQILNQLNVMRLKGQQRNLIDRVALPTHHSDLNDILKRFLKWRSEGSGIPFPSWYDRQKEEDSSSVSDLRQEPLSVRTHRTLAQLRNAPLGEEKIASFPAEDISENIKGLDSGQPLLHKKEDVLGDMPDSKFPDR